MDKYKKFMYIGIFILLISLVSSAGTYAWFTWISPSNTNVTLSIGNLADVTFTSGPDINISNLAPVYNYTDGVSTTFTVRNTNSTDSLLYKVKLEITSIANELKDESFKYTLLKDNKVVKTGNLKDAVNGNTLILNTSSLDKGSTSSPKISTFKLYFWIDGNMENNSNMMNKSLVGKIDVGVETNVITNTESSISSTSKFLNSEVPRQNITTLKVVDNLDIPEGATVVDVSKNNDNTIKMWYNEADANGNYDITIGSNNKIYANPSSTSGLFSNLTNVTSIDLSNMDTSGMTNMSNMFSGNTSLTNITFGENFNTSNVTSMYAMFNNCNLLKKLDLSSFNTAKVTSMNYMFENCSSLTSLDLSSFDTSNVRSMSTMFRECTNLMIVDLSSFAGNNLISMSYMFTGCSNLQNVDLSNLKVNNPIEIVRMFADCENITSINLKGFKLSSLAGAFTGCSNLEYLNLEESITDGITNLEGTFSGLKKLKYLDLSSWDVSQVTNLSNTFDGDSSLEMLNLNGWKISNKVTTLYATFRNCSSLTTLDLSDWDTSGVTEMQMAFRNCSSLINLDLRNADFSNVNTEWYNSLSPFYLINSNIKIYLKDTETNRNFMNANFNNINTSYIS